MKSVKAIAEDIVRREGGYVDDPSDPGGPTKYGVTLGTLRRLKLDLTRDQKIDRDDVLAMTRLRARDIYIRDYFKRPRLDTLPQVLQASVFDMYVNAGANAVEILQRLLRDMGQMITVDGIVGPQTAGAAELAHAAAPKHLVDAYGIARRNYYYRIADRRAGSRKYARRIDGGKGGWILRAEEFIAPRYHLSAAEHRARVARWG
ncbi:MAG: N-acetylmuramidase [Marinosulfonomonas sp.]|nr:N-acetylmuramidase [Marinosulfonomonas sp.]